MKIRELENFDWILGKKMESQKRKLFVTLGTFRN